MKTDAAEPTSSILHTPLQLYDKSVLFTDTIYHHRHLQNLVQEPAIQIIYGVCQNKINNVLSEAAATLRKAKEYYNDIDRLSLAIILHFFQVQHLNCLLHTLRRRCHKS